jgi:hypothetical protein
MVQDGHGFASIDDYPALGEVPSCREVPDGRLARFMKMLRPCAGPDVLHRVAYAEMQMKANCKSDVFAKPCFLRDPCNLDPNAFDHRFFSFPV